MRSRLESVAGNRFDGVVFGARNLPPRAARENAPHDRDVHTAMREDVNDVAHVLERARLEAEPGRERWQLARGAGRLPEAAKEELWPPPCE
jgi:hypothetical protein